MASSSRVDAVQQRVEEVRRRLQSLQTTVTATSLLGQPDDDDGNNNNNDGNQQHTRQRHPQQHQLPGTPNSHQVLMRERQGASPSSSVFEPATASSTFEEVRRRLNSLKLQKAYGVGGDRDDAAAALHGTAQQQYDHHHAATAANAAASDEATSFQSIRDRISSIAARLTDTSRQNSRSESEDRAGEPSVAATGDNNNNMSSTPFARRARHTSVSGGMAGPAGGVTPILTSERLVRGMFTPKSAGARTAGRSSSAGGAFAAATPQHSAQPSTQSQQPPQSQRTSGLKFAAQSLFNDGDAHHATLVSGAELFAVLRLRGVITTHGTSGEHLLPGTAVHKFLLTTNELSQLQTLRAQLALEREAGSSSSGGGGHHHHSSSSKSRAMPLPDKAVWSSVAAGGGGGQHAQQQQPQQQPASSGHRSGSQEPQQQPSITGGVRWR